MAGEIEQLTERTLTHVVGHDSGGLAGRQAVAASFRVLAQSGVGVTCPDDTTEDVLATVTIPAGAMGANGRLRIFAKWQMTNNANVKTGRIRLGGIGGTILAAETLTSIATLASQRSIENRNAQNSQLGAQGGATGGFVGSSIAFATAAIDTSAETTLVLTGQKATAGDSLALESYCVELFYQA